jgi:hypothetical protein
MNWHAMALLGAYHGINPGMGWLFAVALGLQQGSARGVWRALTPIAVGHAAAVGGVVATATLAGLVVPLDVLKVVVASMLIAFGVYRLWHHRHPRYGGMRVGFRDLAVWSFLMASAHGAGFMVLPFVMPGASTMSAAGHEHAHHVVAAHASVAATTGVMAVAVHSMAYLAVMGLAAWVVYRWLGLGVLRTAWLNLDWLWAGVLVVTGVIVFVS